MSKLKVLLMAVVCASLLGFSGFTVANAADSAAAGGVITPEGTSVKQGWSCYRALRFYRTSGKTYSWLYRSNSRWMYSYDNLQETAFIGASDNYSMVCIYIYNSAGNYTTMYSY